VKTRQNPIARDGAVFYVGSPRFDQPIFVVGLLMARHKTGLNKFLLITASNWNVEQRTSKALDSTTYVEGRES
jgi:hypothetical protein